MRQPFAAWIAAGEKTIELRTWKVAPGPLLIASTARIDPDWNDGKRDDDEMILGKLICLVNVTESRMTRAQEDADKAQCILWPEDCHGLWSIILADPRAVKHEPIKGRLGLFPVDKFKLV